MSLINIILDNGKFLNRPLAHIYESLNLGSGCTIKSFDRLFQLIFKLTIVAVDEINDVYHLCHTILKYGWLLSALILKFECQVLT